MPINLKEIRECIEKKGYQTRLHTQYFPSIPVAILNDGKIIAVLWISKEKNMIEYRPENSEIVKKIQEFIHEEFNLISKLFETTDFTTYFLEGFINE